MYDTDKEKRKGTPPQRWRQLRRAISVVIAVAVVWIVGQAIFERILDSVASTLPTAPGGRQVSLATFDIAEARNEVGMVWNEYNITGEVSGTFVVASWSKVKTLEGNARPVGWGWASPATLIQLHPSEDLPMSWDFDGSLNLNDKHGFQMPSNIVKALYSPQGTWLALLYANRISYYRLTGTQPSYFDLSRTPPLLRLDTLTPHDIAISPDDKTLAVIGDSADGGTAVVLYDLMTRSLKAQLDLPHGSTMSLAFHPTKPELAVGLDNMLYRLDTVPGATRSFPVPLERIDIIDYDATGRWLALMGQMSGKGNIYIYDLDSVTEIPTQSHPIPQTAPVKAQFIKEGLVIGERAARFTLWQWQNETWEKTQTWPIVLTVTNPYAFLP